MWERVVRGGPDCPQLSQVSLSLSPLSPGRPWAGLGIDWCVGGGSGASGASGAAGWWRDQPGDAPPPTALAAPQCWQ